jgi:hypothetical protein
MLVSFKCNLLVVNVPFIIGVHMLSKARGYSMTGALPEPIEFFRDMTIFLAIEETWYFFSHW